LGLFPTNFKIKFKAWSIALRKIEFFFYCLILFNITSLSDGHKIETDQIFFKLIDKNEKENTVKADLTTTSE